MPIVDEQFRLQLIGSFLHADLPGVLFPIAEILMQFVLPKEFQLHQSAEEIGLSAPFLQRDEP